MQKPDFCQLAAQSFRQFRLDCVYPGQCPDARPDMYPDAVFVYSLRLCDLCTVKVAKTDTSCTVLFSDTIKVRTGQKSGFFDMTR